MLVLSLLKHLLAVHGELMNSPFKYIESTFPPARATPHVLPPLHSVARMYEGKKLIMKCYGEVDHVILFYDFPIHVTYSIRDGESRVRTLVFWHHVSNPFSQRETRPHNAIHCSKIIKHINKSTNKNTNLSLYETYTPCFVTHNMYTLVRY